MDNEMDKEPQEAIAEPEEVSSETEIKSEKEETVVHENDSHADQGHDSHADHEHDSHADHGHGHGHSSEEDAIVLHQEKLLPTILLATALVIVTLFGLSQAGNSRMDISTGKSAFDKVQAMMPKQNTSTAGHVKRVNVPMTNPTVQYKTENNNKEEKSNAK